MKPYINTVVSLTAALLLSACGGGSSETSSVTADVHGKLVDAPVAGADYHCGAIQGKTEADGSFECHAYPVTFSVGGVILGTIYSVPADSHVTPQDLLGVPRDTYNTQVENMGIFLQSLDDDGDIHAAITIDLHCAERLEDIHADMHSMTEEQVMQLLDQAQAVNIATRDEAVKHMHGHLDSLIDGNYSENGNYGDDRDHDTDTDDIWGYPGINYDL